MGQLKYMYVGASVEDEEVNDEHCMHGSASVKDDEHYGSTSIKVDEHCGYTMRCGTHTQQQQLFFCSAAASGFFCASYM